MNLQAQFSAAMKEALRAGEKQRLGAIRLMMAEVQRAEIGREAMSETEVLSILNRMVKQRREAATQFEQAGRDELAAQEKAEISVIQEFLPAPLSREEIAALAAKAIADTGASSPKDMGQIMTALKKDLAGRADMKEVSTLVQEQLKG